MWRAREKMESILNSSGPGGRGGQWRAARRNMSDQTTKL